MSATGGKDEGGDEGGLVDVTALFRRAASSLTMRDPLLRAGAPLGEYMSALEVTDPIMDCCELPLAAGRGGEGEGGGKGREEEEGEEHFISSSGLVYLHHFWGDLNSLTPR